MILVVEDDDDVRETMVLALEGRAFPVVAARNGEEALAALLRDRPCLMILDLMMPVMSGWDVIEHMKARQLADVPVCVISALTGRVPPGVAACLSKPFEFRELLAVAERFCPHRVGAEAHSAGL